MLCLKSLTILRLRPWLSVSARIRPTAISRAYDILEAGIKSTNALHCIHGAVSAYGRSLDGLAVVSDIVASRDPYNAAKRIATIVQAFKANPLPCFSTFPPSYASDGIKHKVGELLSAVKKFSPLVHQVQDPRTWCPCDSQRS